MPIDYSKYPENWLTEIRPAILARDKNRCVHCKVTNNIIIKRYLHGFRAIAPVEYEQMRGLVKSGYNRTQAIKILGFTKIVLTIAHLNQDITDNRPENLAALCQRCHLKHDRNYTKQQRKNLELKQQLLLAL